MKFHFLYLCLAICAASSWPAAWNMGKKFKSLLLSDQLPCGDDKADRPAACCVCYAIVHRIEEQLNNTLDQHPVDTVFRLSEAQVTIPFSHSEDRLLQVFDSVCSDVTFSIPHEGDPERVDSLMTEACERFVANYEDELIHVFYNNASPSKERMCRDAIGVCSSAATQPPHEEL